MHVFRYVSFIHQPYENEQYMCDTSFYICCYSHEKHINALLSDNTKIHANICIPLTCCSILTTSLTKILGRYTSMIHTKLTNDI